MTEQEEFVEENNGEGEVVEDENENGGEDTVDATQESSTDKESIDPSEDAVSPDTEDIVSNERSESQVSIEQTVDDDQSASAGDMEENSVEQTQDLESTEQTKDVESHDQTEDIDIQSTETLDQSSTQADESTVEGGEEEESQTPSNEDEESQVTSEKDDETERTDDSQSVEKDEVSQETENQIDEETTDANLMEESEIIEEEEGEDGPIHVRKRKRKRKRRRKRRRRRTVSSSRDVVVKEVRGNVTFVHQTHKFRKTITRQIPEETPGPAGYNDMNYFRYTQDASKGHRFGTESRFSRSIYKNNARKKRPSTVPSNYIRLGSTLSKKGPMFSVAHRFNSFGSTFKSRGQSKEPGPSQYKPALPPINQFVKSFGKAKRFPPAVTRGVPAPNKYLVKDIRNFGRFGTKIPVAKRKPLYTITDTPEPWKYNVDMKKLSRFSSRMRNMAKNTQFLKGRKRVAGRTYKSDEPGPGSYSPSKESVEKTVRTSKWRVPRSVEYYYNNKKRNYKHR